jgi:hypothetical protein
MVRGVGVGVGVGVGLGVGEKEQVQDELSCANSEMVLCVFPVHQSIWGY